ncbi:MAG: hypothetical protein J6S57_00885 [Alphaproteobacteria bacterium]|nr:hypothetical protein [Alphaproteobacteria bacterium]
MKNYVFLLIALSMVGCSAFTKPDNGITKLDYEPKNCTFLYEIKSNYSGYSEDAAYDFIEKRIVEENAVGDTYYITNQDIVENKGAVFGPQNTYKLKAMVYNCKE